MNCHKFNGNCVLKESLLAIKNFGFLKTHKSGYPLYKYGDRSQHSFYKTAAPVSPRRGYPELPDLPDSPLRSYTTVHKPTGDSC